MLWKFHPPSESTSYRTQIRASFRNWEISITKIEQDCSLLKNTLRNYWKDAKRLRRTSKNLKKDMIQNDQVDKFSLTIFIIDLKTSCRKNWLVFVQNWNFSITSLSLLPLLSILFHNKRSICKPRVNFFVLIQFNLKILLKRGILNTAFLLRSSFRYWQL